MDDVRIKEIFSDEAFVTSLLKLETPEEAQAALKEKGLELNNDEILAFRDMLMKTLEKAQKNGGVLSIEDLDEAAGGVMISQAAAQVVSRVVPVVAVTVAAGVSTAISFLTRGRW